MPLLECRNVTVLGVFHELSVEGSARIRATYDLNFRLVDDPDGHTADLFGLRRSRDEMAEIVAEFGPELLALKEGQPWISPMQARYLIRRDGIIVYSEVVTDYQDRSGATGLVHFVEEAR